MKFPGLRVTYYRQNLGGGESYHAHFLSLRRDNWFLCGVLHVDPTDWFCFLHMFRTHGIEVIETDGDTLPFTPSDCEAH
jgi:hypothetical protein